jgi:hypothetical protein
MEMHSSDNSQVKTTSVRPVKTNTTNKKSVTQNTQVKPQIDSDGEGEVRSLERKSSRHVIAGSVKMSHYSESVSSYK